MHEELLPRKELIQLWEDIAKKFDTQLIDSVNNGISLVLKFNFENEYGVTEVMIKDLAGRSAVDARSSMASIVSTELHQPIDTTLKISLPPLIPWIPRSKRKMIREFTINGTDHWMRSNSPKLMDNLLEYEQSRMDQFDPVYVKTEQSEVFLQCNRFLGKEKQIISLIKFHLRLLKLLKRYE